jgi:hypothetical protein
MLKIKLTVRTLPLSHCSGCQEWPGSAACSHPGTERIKIQISKFFFCWKISELIVHFDNGMSLQSLIKANSKKCAKHLLFPLCFRHKSANQNYTRSDSKHSYPLKLKLNHRLTPENTNIGHHKTRTSSPGAPVTSESVFRCAAERV